MPKKILIVDDEKNLVSLLKKILESNLYKVDCVYDGFEAFKKVTDSKFDLILLDIKMPKMDGKEFYKKIKEKKINTPVIIVTGSFMREESEQMVKDGAKDIVYKPFDVENLLVKIKQYI